MEKNQIVARFGLLVLAGLLGACGDSDVEPDLSLEETQTAVAALEWGDSECFYVLECDSPGMCITPPGAVVREDGTVIVGVNDWTEGGPYHIIDHQCHHAANAGCDADETGNTGIIGCMGNSSGFWGHTINWTFLPVDHCGSGIGQVCLTEPMEPGTEACCWDSVFVGPTPDISGAEARACLVQLCGGEDINPTTLSCNFRWDTGPDEAGYCAENTSAPSDCALCCHERTAMCIWPEYQDDANEWLDRCMASCEDANESRDEQGPQAPQDPQPQDPEPERTEGATPWLLFP